ncbi:MAG: hypothetical protein B5M52_05265 [Helicobacteraceae bacterium 4484_230]|nr:MAG: hypothetical protein B5M52_05265 [Helicobacteraceae bacterium 4484_230]
MKKNHLLAAIAFIFIAHIFLYHQISVVGAIYISDENGVLENLQVLILFISMLIFLIASIYSKKRDRAVLFSGALLCLTFLLREVDVEDLDVWQIFIFLGSGAGRNVFLSVLWLMMFVVVWKDFSYYRALFVRLLFAMPGGLFVTGGILLLAGSLFDNNVFDVKFYRLYEELLEMNGYYFILLSSIATSYFLYDIRSKDNL